ncbi:MAG: hypothetical protein PUC32_07880 [Oscillospiraceae bacterium]|nr:hypothetical protein [Oscillospiraceae bacterium]
MTNHFIFKGQISQLLPNCWERVVTGGDKQEVALMNQIFKPRKPSAVCKICRFLRGGGVSAVISRKGNVMFRKIPAQGKPNLPRAK